MVNCNFVIHATCPLPLTTYKYSELQVSFATQTLVARPIAKHPFSHNVRFLTMNYVMGSSVLLLTFGFNYFEIFNNNNKLKFLVLKNFNQLTIFMKSPSKI
jgi:hypothetical protein